MTATRRTAFIPGQIEPGRLQAPCKSAAVASIRIDDHDFGMRRGMATNELRQLMRVVAFVQHIAADDEIELPKFRIGPPPIADGVLHRRQRIAAQIVEKKRLDQRMSIARGDVAMAAVDHETREAQAATNLQHPAIVDLATLHEIRKRERRRPHLAEDRPGRRTDADLRGHTVRVVVLQSIQQGADLQICPAGDRHPLDLDLIARVRWR